MQPNIDRETFLVSTIKVVMNGVETHLGYFRSLGKTLFGVKAFEVKQKDAVFKDFSRYRWGVTEQPQVISAVLIQLVCHLQFFVHTFCMQNQQLLEIILLIPTITFSKKKFQCVLSKTSLMLRFTLKKVA